MRDLKPLARLAFCAFVSLLSAPALGDAPEGAPRTDAVISLIAKAIPAVLGVKHD